MNFNSEAYDNITKRTVEKMNFNLKGNNNTHTHKKEVILNLQIRENQTTTHIKHKKNEFQLGSIRQHTIHTQKELLIGCRLLDYW